MSIADQAQAALQCINRGEYQQAVQLFAQAVAASSSSNLWNDLGYAQLARGRVQEAERSFRQALAIAPDNPQAAINLGALLANTGKTEAAVQWLERGVSAIDQTQRAVVLDLLANCKNRNTPPQSAAKLGAHDISESQ
jgi:Flp pilus assembly protein TadD